ncbi:MAG TPA: SRPBCC domain-containing protein [Candidatus Limnocylindrales bacterium]|nr:SRPBCC domain-containing protein [Candidatus Limnocylindrales bacterium]
MEGLEAVFRALADPHRRTLLDRLRDQDGQTLGELEATLPHMTRFGVMKHLKVLEDAHLVVTRRDGRRKLHFLNPLPIRLVADRWISRYAEPLVGAMADIKQSVENRTMAESPKHVYEVYIAASPEQVWRAITESEFTRQYYYDNSIESDWEPGSPIVYRNPDGTEAIQGKIIEADPPRRLVHTFFFPGTDESPSRCTWSIEPRGAASLLILTHDEFDGETSTYRSVAHGWVPILSGLKTLLETGRPLEISYPVAEGVRD